MDRRTFLGAGAALAATLALAHPAAATKKAAAAPVRKLPPAQKSGGKPLMDCLSGRRSTHMPGKKELTEQQLANVLWAACGISSESGKRTVPTAMNRQRIAVYAALKDGVWLYRPAEHALELALAGDRRDDFDGSACVLLYAAPREDPFAGVHVGSMYQNVGLYCTSSGLANCVKHQRHDALDRELPLPEGWEVVMVHSISR